MANFLAWFSGGAIKLYTMEIFSPGFLIGMLAMFIAMHIYRRQIEIAPASGRAAKRPAPILV